MAVLCIQINMSLIYTRELTDEEVQLLEHEIMDTKTWIDEAIQGKINWCRKKLIKTELDKRIDGGIDFPANQAELISTIFSAVDYKNRKDREEELSGQSIKTPL